MSTITPTFKSTHANTSITTTFKSPHTNTSMILIYKPTSYIPTSYKPTSTDVPIPVTDVPIPVSGCAMCTPDGQLPTLKFIPQGFDLHKCLFSGVGCKCFIECEPIPNYENIKNAFHSYPTHFSELSAIIRGIRCPKRECMKIGCAKKAKIALLEYWCEICKFKCSSPKSVSDEIIDLNYTIDKIESEIRLQNSARNH